MDKELQARSNNQCEVCNASGELSVYIVAPKSGRSSDDVAYICHECRDQLSGAKEVDPNHWRCLNDSMWSEVHAVKVIAWRMLNKLKPEVWPADLLEMMYLDDETLSWAKSGVKNDSDDTVIHKDSNGVVLNSGDTVVLTKDLNVKGAGFTAKRGTAVRNISLVHDNAEQIEGRVEGQKIVILTQYVKK